MINIQQITDPTDPEYEKFITTMDQDFLPAISQRDGGIGEFIHIVFRNKGTTWLAWCDGQPCGSFSFWLNEENVIYIWFIGILKELRGSLRGGQILVGLLDHAFRQYDQERTSLPASIHFTTWETNSAAIKFYQVLGFRIARTKENDMVEGRTTLFFEGDYLTVQNRLTRMAARQAC